jgi:hypothetical protein
VLFKKYYASITRYDDPPTDGRLKFNHKKAPFSEIRRGSGTSSYLPGLVLSTLLDLAPDVPFKVPVAVASSGQIPLPLWIRSIQYSIVSVLIIQIHLNVKYFPPQRGV